MRKDCANCRYKNLNKYYDPCYTGTYYQVERHSKCCFGWEKMEWRQKIIDKILFWKKEN